MFLIGEKLNSSIPSAAELMKGADGPLIEMMKRQCEAGADAIDINTAASGDELSDMLRLCELAATNTDAAVMVDSANPDVTVTAVRYLSAKKRRIIVNSVTATARLDECAPIIAEVGAEVVVLPMAGRIPQSAEETLDNARAAVSRLNGYGIANDKIYVDILVEALSADSDASTRTAANLSVLHSAGYRTVAGISNVGFGMPSRTLLNRTFLGAAIIMGLDAAIIDVTSEAMRDTVMAAELIAGRDEFGMEYIGYIRSKS